MKDALTQEQLELQLRKAQQEDPMKLLPAAPAAPAAKGEESPPSQPKDLLSQSDIVCFGGMATLVPKRAILQIPKSMENRLRFAEGSALLGWAEFFAQNRGWITTVEVSRPQAEGNEPLAEDLAKHLKDSANLVVATYLGGPISVLPLKTPSPEKSAATAATSTETKP